MPMSLFSTQDICFLMSLDEKIKKDDSNSKLLKKLVDELLQYSTEHKLDNIKELPPELQKISESLLGILYRNRIISPDLYDQELSKRIIEEGIASLDVFEN